MTGRRVADLLALPVRMHGISLGRPVQALVDASADRLLGLELVCGDGAHRFLPFAVARVGAREIEVGSALALIDERDLDYYRRHSRRVDDVGYDDPWVDDDGGLREARSAA
jgi:hypothetical protein